MARHHFQIGEPNHTAEKTIVVMGVARGGTSMVAGTLRELGINLGVRLGENHEDPKFLTRDMDKLKATIEERNASLGTWGWKMPHSLEYIESLQHDLRNPHFILVWRNSLSAALSQVNRSEADIYNALRYSGAKLQEMVEKTAMLDGPTLLINYEQGTADKENLVQMLADFTGVELTDEVRQNCYRFIDPETGYQQVSETFYQVSEVDPAAHTKPMRLVPVLRHLEPVEDTDQFKTVGPMPRFIFKAGQNKTLPKEFVVKFRNRTANESLTRILFDFDWNFTQNMSHKPMVKPEYSAFKIVSNGSMKRIGIIPTITDGISDLTDVQIYHP